MATRAASIELQSGIFPALRAWSQQANGFMPSSFLTRRKMHRLKGGSLVRLRFLIARFWVQVLLRKPGRRTHLKITPQIQPQSRVRQRETPVQPGANQRQPARRRRQKDPLNKLTSRNRATRPLKSHKRQITKDRSPEAS